jgi:hypothetical protein
MSTNENVPAPRKSGRRSVLKGIGASALATATVVFGTTKAAQAASQACCHLSNPPGGAWSTCANASDKWIWTCTQATPYGACYRYGCCEAGHTPYGTNTISAWSEIGIC